MSGSGICDGGGVGDYVCATALVTGGGSGIGRAISDALGADGVRVFVADRDLDRANEVAGAICRGGGAAEAHHVDVADRSSVGRLFSSLRQRCERLDLLVNCAAILGTPALIEDVSDGEWDRVLAVNLTGAFYCCREAVRWMKEHRRGRIINFASVAALMPTPGAVHYSASKAGVVQLTKTLAREVARHNLRVNAVAPGYVQTPMLDELDQEFKEGILRRTPLERFASPAEIAALVRFLASPEADFFTGQVLSPNGGLVM
jgi:NAD(P)-dependent dehydrogenase (short-subunit alcohol dehydrogenase family)